MIQGFEELTEPISEREAAEFLPPILEGLKTKVGRKKAVTNKAIVAGLRQNRGIRRQRMAKYHRKSFQMTMF